jgi:hypothetical protein
MIRRISVPAKLAIGLGVVFVAAGLSYWKLSAGNITTGILSGLGIAWFGVLLYSVIGSPRWREKGSFWLRYIGGAFLRYTIMIIVFCAAVFVIKINGIGLLIGIFAGMMTATFKVLNKMRHSAPGSAGE